MGMKKTACMTVCVALIALFTAPVAFGQALDGKWFQLKVSFKGYAFEDSTLDKVSGSTTNYMRLDWTGSAYQCFIYTSDGSEIIQDSGFTPDSLEYYETAIDVDMTFGQDDTNYINAYHTSLINIKRDKQGAFKSATFTSLGCEVYDGEMNGATAFGGCTIKGKTIESPPFP
jgi:hypothetical protein